MITLMPAAVFVAVSPPELGHQPDSGRTALALAIVAAVIATAVVTETVRHHRRRHVHHPVPLPPRRIPTPVVFEERRTSDLARPAELVAHHP